MSVEVQKSRGELAGEFMATLIKPILRVSECLKNEGEVCEW